MTISFQLLELTSTAVQILLISFFLTNVINSKLTAWKTILIYSLGQAVMAFLSMPVRNILFLYIFLTNLPVWLITFFLSQETFLRKNILFFFHFLTVMVSDAIGYALLVPYMNPDKPYWYVFANPKSYEGFMEKIPNFVGFTFWSLIYFGITMAFSVFWNKIQKKVKYRLVALLILLPTSQILLLTELYRPTREGSWNDRLIYGMISALIALAADIFIYQTINDSVVSSQNEQELIELKNRQEIQYQ